VAKKKSAEYRVSRRNLFIWGALMVFILIWIFILGILVGRGTAPAPFDPRRLEKELAELKAELLKKQRRQVDAVASGKLRQPDMELFRSLKESGAGPHVDLPPAPAPVPGVKNGQPSRLKALKHETRRRPAAKEASVRPQPKVSAAETAAAGRAGYTVQVASLKDPAAAAKMAAALAGRGLEAYQIKVDLGGKGTWYRVRVGRFADRKAAQKMVERLKKMHYSAMVVRR